MRDALLVTLFAVGQNAGTFAGTSPIVDIFSRTGGVGRVVPKHIARKTKKSSCPRPSLSLLFEITRAWRNWQTRMVQVHMGATP